MRPFRRLAIESTLLSPGCLESIINNRSYFQLRQIQSPIKIPSISPDGSEYHSDR